MENKIVVIGDIHGRTVWEDILLIEADYDKVIFLGDYVASHEGISGEQQIRNLRNIMDLKDTRPDDIILLRGNHDVQYLGYSWAECSSLQRDVQTWLMSQKEEFLSKTQWVYIDEPKRLLFSHAGVSDVWMENSGISDVTKINDLEPSELFGFTPSSYSDYSGNSTTQPPTWIRPWSLYKSRNSGYTQIVGHTPVRWHIVNLSPEYGPGLWLCDALGVGEYLEISKGEFNIKKI